MEALFEDAVDLPLTMPWPMICRLACTACVVGCTLDELIEQALVEHLERPR